MTIKQILLAGAVFFSLSAQGQKNGLTNHRNIIKLNLNTDFDDDFGVPLMFSWETKTNKNQSLQVGLAPRYYKENNYKRSGIGVNGEYRFYISRNKSGIAGVYAGPFLSYNTYKVTDTYNNNYSYRSDDFRGGFLFGHQWVYLSGFTLDLNLGLGFVSSSSNNNNNNNFFDDRSGLLGRFNVGIGYAF